MNARPVQGQHEFLASHQLQLWGEGRMDSAGTVSLTWSVLLSLWGGFHIPVTFRDLQSFLTSSPLTPVSRES